jgi:phosphohistidine phosphatase
MRTLYLLRHAKSSWKEEGLSDRERPLAPRGIKAAGTMASHMRATGVHPALVLCSSARRTRETLDLVAAGFAGPFERSVEDELYGATADDLLSRLRQVPDATRSVMVIGHNPGLEDLATQLAGDGEGPALDQLGRKFPTAALATFDLADTAWSEVGRGQAYLSGLTVPRTLHR